MPPSAIQLSNDAGLWIERQGLATFTRLAFAGTSLGPLRQKLAAEISDDAQGAGIGMDLSAVCQLMGNKKTGLALQAASLAHQRLYRSPCSADAPGLRVLALAAEMDIGGNTPIEFLLAGSDVELITLFVPPSGLLPSPLPQHDVAIVIAPADGNSRGTLAVINRLAARWPRPMLNLPRKIENLDRDRLWRLMQSAPGVEIPSTAQVLRDDLLHLTTGEHFDILPDADFPLVVRPLDSHAGAGLAKLDDPADIPGYLAGRTEERFFISRFVDYSSPDGLFRKYRLALVDGRAYAVHMAISEQWKLWYLNADMALNSEYRAEESSFMASFDEGFARRHRVALGELARCIGLDYCTIDCAESKDGRLLVFEADNTAIVHDMDPPSIYPYKPAQMATIFNAFVEMLYRRCGKAAMRAA
jgi:hypothetical protein